MSDASSVISAVSMLVLAALLVVPAAREVVRAVYDRPAANEDYDNDDEPSEDNPSDGVTTPSVLSAGASVRIRAGNRRDIILVLKANGWSLEQARRVLKGSNESIGLEWRETVAASETRKVAARRLDGTTHTIELGGAS